MSEQLPKDLEFIYGALNQRKARGLVCLDVRGISSVADYMVICSGLSSRQVSALAEHVIVSMKKIGNKALGVEGLQEGQWVLVDYGDVVVHVFFDSTREFYDLEGLWADAKKITPEGMEAKAGE